MFAPGCAPFLGVALWVVSVVVSNGIANHYRCLPCHTEYTIRRDEHVQDLVRAAEITPRHHGRKGSTTPPRHRRSTHDHMRSKRNAPSAEPNGYGSWRAEGRTGASPALRAGRRLAETPARPVSRVPSRVCGKCDNLPDHYNGETSAYKRSTLRRGRYGVNRDHGAGSTRIRTPLAEGLA